jgi:2-polyprenyl-3-methyl-5-hydroxy-6-metoxy-1,4-benzoquinol methylase
MAQHSQYGIADAAAVLTLVGKLTHRGTHQLRRDKLLRALDDATRHYKDSNQKVRQALKLL